MKDHYGNRLKWLIKNRGTSQRKLSLQLDIPESTLSRWTAMKYPDLKDIVVICQVLQIPVSRFFAEDSDQYIEVSPEEMQLIKSFGEFSEDRKSELLRIIEILKGW